MKKTLLLLCATLSCSLAFAQGAELEDETNRLLFIPRVELNPYAGGAGSRYSGKGIDFGNTSLYTLFEGDFGGSNFSYSIEGHWLAGSADEIKNLYRNAFHSQECSFIDWAYLSYSVGNFEFSVGKQCFAMGTYEEDAYDFESYFNLGSTMWNNFTDYQYGVNIGYGFTDGTTLTAQFSSSPFGNKPFLGTENAPALFAWSIKAAGEYGCWAPIWSYNIMQSYAWDAEGKEAGRGNAVQLLSLGNKFTVGDFELIIDYTNRWFTGGKVFDSEMTLASSLTYNLRDKLLLTLKGGYEFNHCGEDIIGWLDEESDPFSSFVPTSLVAVSELNSNGYVYGGAAVEYFPLRNSRDLKLHALVASNNWSKSTSFTLGLSYYFDLLKYIRK